MRKYTSTNGKMATMEKFDASYGFSRGSHIECEVLSDKGRAWNAFANYGDAFEWLVSNFGCGWVRVRD